MSLPVTSQVMTSPFFAMNATLLLNWIHLTVISAAAFGIVKIPRICYFGFAIRLLIE